MRALSFSEITARLDSDERGIKCLKYSGMAKHADFQCCKGHEWSANASSVIHGGRGCPICRSENLSQILSSITPKKAAKRLKADGRGIICVEFKGMANRKSKFTCSKDHTWIASADSVINGKRGCPTCANQLRGQANRITIGQVKQKLAADGRGITCLAFTKTHSKAKFRCKNGHTFTAQATNIINAGQGCRICGIERSAKSRSILRPEFERRLKNDGRGYTCLNYVNMSQNAKFRCAEGHEWKAVPSAILISGNGCGVCSGHTPITFDAVKRRLEADGRGITCLKYARTYKKATFRCDDGHIWNSKATDVINKGSGCPICVELGFRPEKPAYVYLFWGEDDGRLNFGVTGNLARRQRDHERDDKQVYALLRKHYCATGLEALEIESAILSECASRGFKPLLGSREEFQMSVSEARAIFDHLVRRNASERTGTAKKDVKL